MKSFSSLIIAWQKKHGRHNLPWQVSDPYKIWISEIMLQQTQVKTVIPYFEKFIVRFPDIKSLAAANQSDVLALWSGLGYYARARNLHVAAKQIMDFYQGAFPKNRWEIEKLQGIGRSTAAAIAVFAFGSKEAICDGNVKRLLSRFFAFGEDISKTAGLNKLWLHAENLLPEKEIITYTQALMDLGSSICTRSQPNCGICPVAQRCVAYKNNTINEYPRKAKKIQVQRQSAYFILIMNKDDEIYMQQRPDKGIWGGLWTLPWFETVEQAQKWCQKQGIQATIEFDDKATLVHHFTHIRLEIYVCQLIRESTTEIPLLNIDHFRARGLPKAMEKILALAVNQRH